MSIIKKHWPTAAICGGLLLLALSYAWPSYNRRNWTDEQQNALTAAQSHYHRLPHDPKPGESVQGLRQKQEAAREDYNTKNEQLEMVRSTGRRNERVLFWCGVLTTTAGLVAYFRRKADAEAKPGGDKRGAARG